MDPDEVAKRLDLDTKAALVAGQDRWSLPAGTCWRLDTRWPTGDSLLSSGTVQ